ncbi:MAG: beta-ketoacyl-ACP synthase, partial [Myxococcales bacterium]|nr:beta-ketoacyl-ACP synthase [Myxococcales bacterium]
PCPLEVPFEALCGAVQGDLPPMPKGREDYQSRVVRLALLAYEEMRRPMADAVARWGASRVGMVLGTSTGGIGETETAFDHYIVHGRAPEGYDFARQHAFCAFADVLREIAGTTGPRYVVSTACSSSTKVFGAAQRLLDADIVDAVLVGGVDALCLTTVRGFHSLGVMADGESRPFGENRPGLNIGEGAALLLVERDGQARARLLGVGESSDAFHMSAPDPEGRGAQAAMEQALAQAGLRPEDIDHVNAHGTSTPENDKMEWVSLAQVLGPRAGTVPVTSNKSQIGHTLIAAGAVEAVISVMTMTEGVIPPTINHNDPDPEIGLDVVANSARTARVRTILSNSFGFGGQNVCLVLAADPR